ncbi:ABC-F family ATP-binding cassette domain-containing protein [Porphyromonas pogonae]|uniref:ABC-F family ATP-binding cassette domain-containing protein n=1 Tax=Porphyromonas pogonae TaxID=867595 RepID=UPI002E778312|nr:ABC-F family ATP-binding cassette domain-containing protein [Porphyromonas pogonae]
MLQIDNLTKSFGDRILFQNISFSIDKGQKVGLIAPNGTGKTTLINLLAGIDTPDSGNIIFQNGVRWSYLPQLPHLPETGTILEACFSKFDPVAMLTLEWEKALAENDDEKMQKLLPEMEALDAWSYEQRAKEILGQLGLNDWDKPVTNLSGGETKRIALAAALISNPDLLFLDEPTNHLDLKTIEWLEGYLSRSLISLLLVTHDRYFLDRVCNQILEIDSMEVYKYKGNYNYYLEKRQERLDAEQKEIEKSTNIYRRELDWMRRQPQARAGKAKARIDAFYDLEKKTKSQRNDDEVNLGSAQAGHIGKKIFEAEHISKSFGDKIILKDFNYIFSRFDKVGVVGENGVGKTSFLRLLLGEIQPDKGAFEIGSTIRFGYYSQKDPSFDPNKRVIDVVKDIAENIEFAQESGIVKVTASQILTQFLFSPEKQYTPVGKLSGGELRRLYLCTVLIGSPNFLILDEPTNDLDILTLNILEQYLIDFTGCVLIVSHDRFFMDKVVNHLLCFEGEGVVRDFPGNYSQYRSFQELKEQEIKAEEQKVNEPAKVKTEKPQGNNRQRKLSFKEKQELDDLLKKIPQLEAERSDLEVRMSSGALDNNDLLAAGNRIAAIIEELDTLTLRWLELEELQ